MALRHAQKLHSAAGRCSFHVSGAGRRAQACREQSRQASELSGTMSAGQMPACAIQLIACECIVYSGSASKQRPWRCAQPKPPASSAGPGPGDVSGHRGYSYLQIMDGSQVSVDAPQRPLADRGPGCDLGPSCKSGKLGVCSSFIGPQCWRCCVGWWRLKPGRARVC